MKPTPIQVDLRRAPLPEGAHPEDPARRRRWALEEAERAFVIHGVLTPRLLALTSDHLLESVVPRDQRDGTWADTGAWRSVTRLPGVRCVFRLAELALAPDGHRAVCVGELSPHEEAWWCAWRRVAQTSTGVGRFLEPWHEAAGTGLLQLPSPLARWARDLGKVDLDPRDRSQEPDIRAATFELLDRVPEDLEELATLVERGMRREILEHGLEGILVFAFRGRHADRWEVRGELPCSLDDAVRNFATYSEAEAVAVSRVGRSAVEGEDLPTLFTVVERAGARFERAMPIREGPDGVARAPASFALGTTSLRPGEGWIGVPPQVDLGLHQAADGWGKEPIPEG